MSVATAAIVETEVRVKAVSAAVVPVAIRHSGRVPRAMARLPAGHDHLVTATHPVRRAQPAQTHPVRRPETHGS
jgi:hypothetical protein